MPIAIAPVSANDVEAIAALARGGKAQARMLGSIDITPVQWPTHTLIDWITVLQKVADVPQRDERLAEAQQQLRNRLSYHGSQLAFSTEDQDRWWWLMQDTDSNAARLLLATMGWALGLSGLPLAVMIVAASLPVGANVFLFAQRYEVAQDEVTASVAVSTMLALVTMPVVILLTTRYVV